MFVKVRVFERVPSESASSEKLVGLKPPPPVKAKSCASLGVASAITMICPRLALENVHVTFSPALMLTLDTGLPSLQVADVWSQPLATASETEYPAPGTRFANARVLDSVP